MASDPQKRDNAGYLLPFVFGWLRIAEPPSAAGKQGLLFGQDLTACADSLGVTRLNSLVEGRYGLSMFKRL